MDKIFNLYLAFGAPISFIQNFFNFLSGMNKISEVIEIFFSFNRGDMCVKVGPKRGS